MLLVTKDAAQKILAEAITDNSPENLLKVEELFLHANADTAVAAIKVLSREKNLLYVSTFENILNNPKVYPEKVRKEAMSGLGRMRNEEVAKTILPKYLEDKNPEIILQVIRGLLVFKGELFFDGMLKQLADHKNELIRSIINIEYGVNEVDFDTKASHVESPAEWSNKVVKGDSAELVRRLPNNSIHLTFTSPPYYNARDYSTYKSYDDYLNFLSELFKEIHRATKDGRFLVVNTSPVIVPRVGRKYASKRYPIPYDLHHKLVTNGWEFVDDIIWLKTEASVKNRIANFLQFRKPLAYKPNAVTENLMVYRKTSNKLIDWNLNAYPISTVEKSKVLGEFESSNVWKIDPVYDRGHSAVFPEKLCDNVVKYYSLEGDLVFDPFAGSGTLGKSALKLKRKILLSEADDIYYERLKENLAKYKEKLEFIE
jgi:DNA modification methylase